MEFIIAAIVVALVAYYAFFRKKAEVVEVAPYKVETPVEVQPEFPVKKPRAKKPAVKAKTARKPKAE